jgi:hypothetical protein
MKKMTTQRISMHAQIAISSTYFCFFKNQFELNDYDTLDDLSTAVKNKFISFFLELDVEKITELAIKNANEMHFHGCESIDILKAIASENPDDVIYLCDGHEPQEGVDLMTLIPFERAEELAKCFAENGLDSLTSACERKLKIAREMKLYFFRIEYVDADFSGSGSTNAATLSFNAKCPNDAVAKDILTLLSCSVSSEESEPVTSANFIVVNEEILTKLRELPDEIKIFYDIDTDDECIGEKQVAKASHIVKHVYPEYEHEYNNYASHQVSNAWLNGEFDDIDGEELESKIAKYDVPDS